MAPMRYPAAIAAAAALVLTLPATASASQLTLKTARHYARVDHQSVAESINGPNSKPATITIKACTRRSDRLIACIVVVKGDQQTVRDRTLVRLNGTEDFGMVTVWWRDLTVHAS